jgi:hypothetical protein
MVNFPLLRHAARAGLGALAVAGALAAAATAPHGASAAPAPAPAIFADPAFERVWGRTDFLVSSHQATRSWYWGPAPGRIVTEPYDEGLGRVHLVQYFDKSRMELNNPRADPGSKWYVTNGLLAIEMISGQVQFGNARYVNMPSGPAAIPLASDIDDATAPTYASFSALANTPLGDHKAADRTGQIIVEGINRAGQVSPSAGKDRYDVAYTRFEPLTGHNIARVFWDYLNSRGPVRENGQTLDATLSDPWFFTSGLPISEAYWARVKIAGEAHDVLIQVFERRVLTYIPDYAPAWRVQMGNIGLHYVQWRYPRGLPAPEPTAVPTLGPPSP